MISRRWLLVLLLAILIPINSFGSDDVFKYKMGTANISIAGPHDYVDAISVDNTLVEAAKLLTIKTEQFVKLYYPNSEIKTIEAGQAVPTYATVMVKKQNINNTLSQNEFNKYKANLYSNKKIYNMDNVVATANTHAQLVKKSLSKFVIAPKKLRINEANDLGIIYEGDQFIAKGYVASINQGDEINSLIVVTADIFIKGKLLKLNTYTLYIDADSLSNAYVMSRKWAEYLESIN